jgi:murein DD-endopeptidase MepM/ murein hydrolase activator NlpD
VSISGTLGPRHRVNDPAARSRKINRRLRSRSLLASRQPRRPFLHLLVVAVTVVTAGLVALAQVDSGASNQLVLAVPNVSVPTGPGAPAPGYEVVVSLPPESPEMAPEVVPAEQASVTPTEAPAEPAVTNPEPGEVVSDPSEPAVINVPEPDQPLSPRQIAPAPAPAPPVDPGPVAVTYRVRSGDTALKVAKRFRVSLETILWNNPLVADPNVLFVGQTLDVPVEDGIIYYVKYGDTLSRIADQFSVDPAAILAFAPNGLERETDLLDVGRILIPGGVPPGGSVQPVETPTPEPIDTATPEPTDTATPEPTDTVTPLPTETVTPEPTDTATPEPTDTPTPDPTDTPTLEPTETATPEPTDTPTPEPTATPTEVPAIPVGPAYAIDRVNLRDGPGTDFGILAVIPLYGQVRVTGAPTNSFYPVTYEGSAGWASGDYLVQGRSPQPVETPTPEPTEVPTPEPTETPTAEPTNTPTPQPTETATPEPTEVPTEEPAIPAGPAYTIDRLNLRDGPGEGFGVITVIPQYGQVSVTGGPENNFYPLTYQGLSGWASGDYLLPGQAPEPTETPTPEPTDTPVGGIQFAWPVSGPISSYFGPGHPLGIDIDLYQREGEAIGASAPGTVVFAGGDACCSYGLHVIIDHGGGWTTTYAHFSGIAVSSGQQVGTGTTVGYAGSTGYSTGTHLHFEIRLNNNPLNPLDYLP